MPFQTQVLTQPAPAVAGDFATHNPVATFPAAEGALVAASGGCTVGAFGWVQPDGTTVANMPPTSTATAPDGFVHRNLTGQISSFGTEGSLVIPQGFPVTLFSAGDFWATTSTAATPGQAVVACVTPEAIATAAAGERVAGAVRSRFVVASSDGKDDIVEPSTWKSAQCAATTQR